MLLSPSESRKGSSPGAKVLTVCPDWGGTGVSVGNDWEGEVGDTVVGN